MRFFKWIALAMIFTTLTGCASWVSQRDVKRTASVVDYLYPNAKEAPKMEASVTHLQPPVRVGIAFVPGGGWNSGLPEAEQMKLLERIKSSFSQYRYIGSIEVIPSQYLRSQGGFTNLEQVARMFNVDVVALLSYDQVQFNDVNAFSVLYWTIIGAYVIHGDKYDVQTMVDASVFDVSSRKLLFRAPGTSQIKGSASMAGFSERARAAQLEGYNKAVDELVPNLQAQLASFKERIKTDTAYTVENRSGYGGGGDLGWLGVLLAAALAVVGYGQRRKA